MADCKTIYYNSTTSSLNLGDFLYQNATLTIPAVQGYYSSNVNNKWYQTDVEGVIIFSGSCPSFYSLETNYNASDVNAACSESIQCIFVSSSYHLWYDFTNWEKDKINKLKQYTQREIRVRRKDSKIPFMDELKNAWAVITSQSTAAVDAVMNGVPSFCDEMSMAKPVSHTDLSYIETPFYTDNREEWMNSLLANQYTMSEIKNGFAWNRLKNK